MITTVSRRFSSLVFPTVCRCCGSNEADSASGEICSTCWDSSQIFSGNEPVCEKCGALFGNSPSKLTVKCWQCDGHHYDRARSCGIYGFGLSAAVVRLKSVPRLSKREVDLLSAAFDRNEFHTTTLIIPIPLSKQRTFERGFNQAEVIASELSRSTGIRMDGKSLSRSKHSPIHRAGMDRKAREMSVNNAFDVARPNLISGENILLVDDVFTTGATTSFAAKALKRHGAPEVNVLTLARALQEPN